MSDGPAQRFGQDRAVFAVMALAPDRTSRAAAPRPVILIDAIVETPPTPNVHVVRDQAVLHRIGRIRHRQYVDGQGNPMLRSPSSPAA